MIVRRPMAERSVLRRLAAAAGTSPPALALVDPATRAPVLVIIVHQAQSAIAC